MIEVNKANTTLQLQKELNDTIKYTLDDFVKRHPVVDPLSVYNVLQAISYTTLVRMQVGEELKW